MGLQDQFDQIADRELHWLEAQLGTFDPDELDVELSQGVLTLTLADDAKIVINSHHAAGEIWMAAFRQAWHFAPHQEEAEVVWRTASEELHTTLSRVLTEKLGREVRL